MAVSHLSSPPSFSGIATSRRDRRWKKNRSQSSRPTARITADSCFGILRNPRVSWIHPSFLRAARSRSMSIPNDLEVEHPPRRRRRRWLRLLLGALSFIVAIVVVGVICYKRAEARAQKDLDVIIAELDAADPL